MNPIPALIVDDEYLIRSLVRNSVDWSALGFELVGEAEDGEEALRMVEELKPRFMLVDINIPFINGLDLSMRIREHHPEILIVILTGYEDFQFARKAIKVGVVDYLLKPLNPAELEKALISAREGILRGDEENRVASEDAVHSKEEALRELLFKNDSALSSSAIPFLLNIEPETRQLVLCLIEIDPPEAPELVRSRISVACEVFSDRDGRLILLFNEDDRTIRLKDKDYYGVCERLVADLVARGHIASVGISRPVLGFSSLPAAYSEASAAIDESFHSGINRVYAHPSVRPVSAVSAKLPTLPSRESIIMLLRSGNEKEVVRVAQTVFRELGLSKAARPYCEMLCLELILVVNEYLKDADLSIADVLGTEDDYYSLVRARKTRVEMEEWLLDLIKRSVVTVETQGKTRTHLVVKKAKLYIEKNYVRKGITLELVAEHAAVTASYISTIFKKEMGISVIEYLTNTRLEAAKKIMDADPLVTIIEVADHTGYSDPYYFSKCFRKRFGLAPTAYLHKKNPAAFE
ncbi:MAG: response regulator [Treponemataceae bacterium]